MEDGSIRTNIDGETPDGWKEDLDIRASDEFGVHSSSVFEESATQQGFGSKGATVSAVFPMRPLGKLHTFQTSRRRQEDTKPVLLRPSK